MPGAHLFTGVTSKLTSLGIAGKAGLATTLTTVVLGGAGAAGALPAPADHAVRSAIESVSPLDFDEPGDHRSERFGADVSADATGESDGDNGVDGPSIAGSTPGAVHRSDPAAPDDTPRQTGETGLTRANETPAAPHAPDVPPSTVPAPGGPAEPGTDRPAPEGLPGPVPGTVPPRGGGADAPPPAD
jgi:hypothetical protein